MGKSSLRNNNTFRIIPVISNYLFLMLLSSSILHMFSPDTPGLVKKELKNKMQKKEIYKYSKICPIYAKGTLAENLHLEFHKLLFLLNFAYILPEFRALEFSKWLQKTHSNNKNTLLAIR